MSSPAVAYASQNHARFLDELKALLRIPSISTLPEHNDDCRKAAEVLAAELKRIGMEHVRLIETVGTSPCLCRLAARQWQAYCARLRPLRRAAPRSDRRMALAALRACGAQRQPLRPRRGRTTRGRWGAGQGAGVAARRQPRAAAECARPVRGRRRSRRGGNCELRSLKAAGA